MTDLYANIALENMLTNAGECKCEAASHVPEYPCTENVVAMIRFTCADSRPIVCANIVREFQHYASLNCDCPCGKPMVKCWTVIPI